MVPLIAAGIGLAAAAANYKSTQDKIESTKDMYNNISEQAKDVENANARDISSYRAMLNDQYGREANQYSQALRDFMNSPVYQNEGFQYTGNVEDYLDPARDQRVAAAMNAIENAAASGGSRFSSQYLDAQAAKQQALASDEWKNAYDRLVQDRQMQLSAYNANSQNAWNNYNAQTQKAQFGINQYGSARDALNQGLGEAMSAQVANRTAGLQSQANALAGLANTNNQDQSFLGQLAGPAASFLGSYFSGGGGS